MPKSASLLNRAFALPGGLIVGTERALGNLGHAAEGVVGSALTGVTKVGRNYIDETGKAFKTIVSRRNRNNSRGNRRGRHSRRGRRGSRRGTRRG